MNVFEKLLPIISKKDFKKSVKLVLWSIFRFFVQGVIHKPRGSLKSQVSLIVHAPYIQVFFVCTIVHNKIIFDNRKKSGPSQILCNVFIVVFFMFRLNFRIFFNKILTFNSSKAAVKKILKIISHDSRFEILIRVSKIFKIKLIK